VFKYVFSTVPVKGSRWPYYSSGGQMRDFYRGAWCSVPLSSCEVLDARLGVSSSSCQSPFYHCNILICHNTLGMRSIAFSVFEMDPSSFTRQLTDHRASYTTWRYLNKLAAYGVGERGSIPSGWFGDFLYSTDDNVPRSIYEDCFPLGLDAVADYAKWRGRPD
jgi:hypothetical protein